MIHNLLPSFHFFQLVTLLSLYLFLTQLRDYICFVFFISYSRIPLHNLQRQLSNIIQCPYHYVFSDSLVFFFSLLILNSPCLSYFIKENNNIIQAAQGGTRKVLFFRFKFEDHIRAAINYSVCTLFCYLFLFHERCMSSDRKE